MAKNVKKTSVSAAAEESLTYEKIVETFKNRAAKSKPPADARVAAQVKLYGAVEGILYVLIADGVAVVEPFDYKGADIEIDSDAEAFMAVLDGKKKMSDVICGDEVKMQGNAGKAIVLASAVF
ncbi:MAG: SCP2 sterol-binding domain-containing protein [Ruminococcus sp.]|nr:SCP2 sterol-binding domain-containing protein [Ruminococcus sp.]